MEPGDKSSVLSSLRKKRGIVKHSITRLVNTLKTLEITPTAPGFADQAKQLVTKLGFDKDFRSLHYEISESSRKILMISRKHEVLDKHEDDVTATSLRLLKLITCSSSVMDATTERASSRKLSCVERRLRATNDALALLKEDHDDVALLEQYQEQMGNVKELSATYEEFVAIDLPDDHALVIQHAHLEKVHFARTSSRSCSAFTLFALLKPSYLH